MTLDPAEGQGSVKSYLVGARAEATVEADIYPRFDPPLRSGLDSPTMDVEAAAFDVDDYVVVSGQPTGLPICHANALTRVGIGVYHFTDKPPAPQDVQVGSTVRWLPTPDTFVQDQAWYPFFGAGITLVPGVSPYYDNSYTFDVRGSGDSITTSAVIFDGDAWLQTDDVNWSAYSFTFMLTAVLHQNPEGPAFGLFESYTPPSDPEGVDTDADIVPVTATDWGVRYRQGTMEMWAGSSVVTHPVSLPQARAVVVAVAMDPSVGKLVIVDRNKSTRSFSTDGMNLFDVQLFLGRTGGDFNAGQTAYMDVLEVNYWDRALSFDELADAVHTMDSLYGVVDA